MIYTIHVMCIYIYIHTYRYVYIYIYIFFTCYVYIYIYIYTYIQILDRFYKTVKKESVDLSLKQHADPMADYY